MLNEGTPISAAFILSVLIAGCWPSSVSAKCFASSISEIVYSSASYQAKVISSTRFVETQCSMAVEINGITITGISESKAICNARLGSRLLLRTRTHCCDQPPCPPGPTSEIMFVQDGEGGLVGARARIPKEVAGLQLVAELKSYSELSYRMINTGKEAVTLGVMSCTKMDNWSTDSSAVKFLWPGKGCDKNVCSQRILKNGDSLKGTLQIEFGANSKATGFFRLYFRSCMPMGMNAKPKNVVQELWSEPIEMKMASDRRRARPAVSLEP